MSTSIGESEFVCLLTFSCISVLIESTFESKLEQTISVTAVRVNSTE